MHERNVTNLIARVLLFSGGKKVVWYQAQLETVENRVCVWCVQAAGGCRDNTGQNRRDVT